MVQESGGNREDSAGRQPPENRLASEKSPYLRQHARDPVAWYPWGEEAFARAMKEDKPVFLSIGYSTCHWCHVMAEESFRNEDVARLLNDSFIAIKVDREERPDIDRIYMAVCQMMTGSGGWPLSLFLTPDKQPFFAATYVPRERRFGNAGLLDLLPRISQLWKNQRTDLAGSAGEVSDALLSSFQNDPVVGEPGSELLTEAFESLVPRFDSDYGGFDAAPKFPLPPILMFLLRYWKRTGSATALSMVTGTLDGIQRGGIYDHLGGGVHRYSTDRKWRIPHFEKMLYDQALLAIVFTEAFLATGKPGYRETVTEILAYMLRDLRAPEGAFFSAEDADSPGGEGAFYLWTAEEFSRILGERDASIARSVFNVREDPDTYDPANDHSGNVLYRNRTVSSLAEKFAMSEEEMAHHIAAIRSSLFSARQERLRPMRDEKVLSDWNGLAIAALAKSAQAFGTQEYAAAAGEAASFILERMRMPDNGLYHRYCCGETAVAGFAEDYAGMIWGLTELYEATFDEQYLRHALDLTRYLATHFHDAGSGGFYSTADTAEQLLVRTKEYADGVVPSSNSLIFYNLLRLSRLIGETRFEELASEIPAAFGTRLAGNPSAHSFFLSAFDYATGNPTEVVITMSRDEAGTKAMIDACRTGFNPSLIVRLIRDTGLIGTSSPYGITEEYPAIKGNATAYICTKQACSEPVIDPGRLHELLEPAAIRPPDGK